MTKEELTEQIQRECHAIVEAVLTKSQNPNITVQDATNVFILTKLAEFELRLRKLEETTVRKLPDHP